MSDSPLSSSADINRLRQVVENASIAILVFDADLTLVYANTQAQELLDISSRRLLGSHVSKLIWCPNDLAETALKRALASGQSYTEHDLVIELSDARQIAANCTVTPIEGESGVELLLELQPLGRQKQIIHEEQLIAQQDAVRSIIRGLAHEIKNPLGGLRGAAQLLQSEIEDKGLRDYTEIIMQEADRLRALVDRLPGPRHVLVRRMVNIHKILERVRMLVHTEQGDGIRVINDYDPSIPKVNVDVDKMVQAVLNVVRNAAQALGEHGEIIIRSRIARHMTIAHQRHGMVVKVDIIDNGCGVAEDMMEKLFFPMVTGRAEGTGLGLSIAQSIISQHGGLIECASKPGKTVFTILLPLGRDDD